MPSISQHQSADYTKLLLIGHSGAGKTGALVSLVLAGYKIRVLDLDNGMDIVANYLTTPTSPYYKEVQEKKINLDDAVRYVTLTEPMKNINGKIIPARATVWNKAMMMMTKWKDGDLDLGNPGEWGSDTILVIDSLSKLSQRGFQWVQSMNGRLGSDAINYEYQRDIGQAQTGVQGFLDLIADSNFKTNVIVISHIAMVRERQQGAPAKPEEQNLKAFPEAVGSALLPKIPRGFNNVIQAATIGSGIGTKHKLLTTSQGEVDLKTSAPSNLKRDYPIETGLAEIFAALRKTSP